MCCKTTLNPINITVTTAAQEILGPNPKRKAVVFMPFFPAVAGDVVSLSPRQDVTAGRGMMNYQPDGGVWPILTDEDIGSAIQLPLWAITNVVAGVPVQIVEYSYEQEEA
jgi:hypothetical protein